jgi:hypothetical protein
MKKGDILKDLSSTIRNLGRERYNKIRLSDLFECFGPLRAKVHHNRELYKCRFGKLVPFVHVAHDGYDRVTKDALGVSIFFIDRFNWKLINACVGVVNSNGKKVRPVSDQVKSLLQERIGITQEDIFSAINDTSNSAVLAGKQIAGTNVPGTCDMHVFELALKHATGMKSRSKNKVICDQNPEFVALHDKFNTLVSWITNKKAKSRFCKYSESHSGQVIVLEQPGDTRVSGISTFCEDLIRSRYTLDE